MQDDGDLEDDMTLREVREPRCRTSVAARTFYSENQASGSLLCLSDTSVPKLVLTQPKQQNNRTTL